MKCRNLDLVTQVSIGRGRPSGRHRAQWVYIRQPHPRRYSRHLEPQGRVRRRRAARGLGTGKLGGHPGGRSDHQGGQRSEEHTSELQSRGHLVCRLLLEKKKKNEEKEL